MRACRSIAPWTLSCRASAPKGWSCAARTASRLAQRSSRLGHVGTGSPIADSAPIDADKLLREDDILPNGGNGERYTGNGTEGGRAASSGGSSYVPETKTLSRSPLMDPNFLAAREKHHLAKSPGSRVLDDEARRKLIRNPYALALATPIRKCSLTNASLPRFFLEDLSLMAHPVTGETRWVAQEYAPRDPPKDGIKSGTASQVDEDIPSGSVDKVQTNGRTSSSSGPSNSPYHAYLQSNQRLLKALQTPKSGLEKKQSDLGRHLRISPVSRPLVEKVQWLPDMDSQLLELMRRRILEDLRYLGSKATGYIVPCRDWEDARRKKQVGAVIHFGVPLKDTPMSSVEQPSQSDTGAPTEFACLRFDGTKNHAARLVPVFDLLRVLGDEHVATLRTADILSRRVYGRDILVVKHKQVTLPVQMRLWKLEGYLATYGGSDG